MLSKLERSNVLRCIRLRGLNMISQNSSREDDDAIIETESYLRAAYGIILNNSTTNAANMNNYSNDNTYTKSNMKDEKARMNDEIVVVLLILFNCSLLFYF